MIPRFTDREYLDIVYRTDADAPRAVVPEPLAIDEPLTIDEPPVRFEIARVRPTACTTGHGAGVAGSGAPIDGAQATMVTTRSAFVAPARAGKTVPVGRSAGRPAGRAAVLQCKRPLVRGLLIFGVRGGT
ncbi:acetoacetate decarboxylase family protein [Streptomyces sp. NPDC006012]|uniref:acetoacetate decarboxylase family protein n=1 Tax=Streptomyces sp. NPDC006012 TaxID=3364739 RepID=UPI0036C81F27